MKWEQASSSGGGPGRQKQIESQPWDPWGQSAHRCFLVWSSVAALHMHWFSTWAFLMKNMRIINPNGDVWVFVKMSPCPGITGFSMEWAQVLPFVCLAGLEVGPRSLFVLDKCSTTDLYSSPHCSLLLKCYNVQSANVRMYFQSRKHFCTNSPLQETSI